MEIIKSTAIPLPIKNIDTDQIIPAQFLKSTAKTGLGKSLFFSWRYNKDGSVNENFVLNYPNRNGSILIAGNNFGCGSSREHAAWALADYGIKAVVSTQFADIFKGNALNNGILPVEVSAAALEALMQLTSENPEAEIKIDLSKQSIEAVAIQLKEHFEINAFKKECLIKGMDETDYLINLREEISAFEKELETY